MASLWYFAAWTDSGCLLGCDHQHFTMASAVACTGLTCAGAYVVAVENGRCRELNLREEVEFQDLMYGNPQRKRHVVLRWPNRWFCF